MTARARAVVWSTRNSAPVCTTLMIWGCTGGVPGAGRGGTEGWRVVFCLPKTEKETVSSRTVDVEFGFFARCLRLFLSFFLALSSHAHKGVGWERAWGLTPLEKEKNGKGNDPEKTARARTRRESDPHVFCLSLSLPRVALRWVGAPPA